MEKYIVSLNIGLEGPDYNAYHILNQDGDVVAIVRTNNNKMLELEMVNNNNDKEALIGAIKDRFPSIDINDYKFIPAKQI